jgi:hypothetical protein
MFIERNLHLGTSHTTLELSKVNTYGLLYVWKGSDASLKPILLAAHQGHHFFIATEGNSARVLILLLRCRPCSPEHSR